MLAPVLAPVLTLVLDSALGHSDTCAYYRPWRREDMFCNLVVAEKKRGSSLAPFTHSWARPRNCRRSAPSPYRRTCARCAPSACAAGRCAGAPSCTCSAPPSPSAVLPSMRQLSKMASPPFRLTEPPSPPAEFRTKWELLASTLPPVISKAPPSDVT